MSLRDERTPHEQIVYARWLDWGTRAGLTALVATFVVYLADWAIPHVPFEQLARAWSLPVAEYRAAEENAYEGGALSVDNQLQVIHQTPTG